MFSFARKKLDLPTPAEALPGRDVAMPAPAQHFVNGHPIAAPFPAGMQTGIFGLGCFWGAERKFWQMPGVYSTAVGYAGGVTPNPTYEEVCSGRTGHAEVVLVVFDPAAVGYADLLRNFWESHDPTQGMRQGNDVGTQVPLRDLRDDAGAASGGGGITRCVRGGAEAGRSRRDHHRDRRGAHLLLRRGLPSAVPRQESGRVLRHWRHRGRLPDRAYEAAA